MPVPNTDYRKGDTLDHQQRYRPRDSNNIIEVETWNMNKYVREFDFIDEQICAKILMILIYSEYNWNIVERGITHHNPFRNNSDHIPY